MHFLFAYVIRFKKQFELSSHPDRISVWVKRMIYLSMYVVGIDHWHATYQT